VFDAWDANGRATFVFRALFLSQRILASKRGHWACRQVRVTAARTVRGKGWKWDFATERFNPFLEKFIAWVANALQHALHRSASAPPP
jgi:hypothetical protein